MDHIRTELEEETGRVRTSSMPESKLRPCRAGCESQSPSSNPYRAAPRRSPASPRRSIQSRQRCPRINGASFLLPPRINGRSGSAHQRSGSRRPSGGSLPSSSGGGDLSTFHASGSPSPMAARPVSRGRRLTTRRTPQRLRPPRSGAACIVPDARDPSRPRLCPGADLQGMPGMHWHTLQV